MVKNSAVNIKDLHTGRVFKLSKKAYSTSLAKQTFEQNGKKVQRYVIEREEKLNATEIIELIATLDDKLRIQGYLNDPRVTVKKAAQERLEEVSKND